MSLRSRGACCNGRTAASRERLVLAWVRLTDLASELRAEVLAAGGSGALSADEVADKAKVIGYVCDELAAERPRLN